MLISALVVYSNGAKTVDSHLTKTDLERLQKVFSDGLKSHDIQSVYYSSLNIDKITKEEKEATCKKLFDSYSESKLNVRILQLIKSTKKKIYKFFFLLGI